MATSSKVGPCRIPTFSSRIPQISKQGQSEPEITSKHVGKRVRVGDKEGILKYVGNVHFAKGTFCGVELTNCVGKNDGCVNGVRYFSCSALCGLMAPLAKVSLIEGSCESLSDGASGPYSMLFLDPKLRETTFSKDVDTNATYDLENQEQNDTFNVRKTNCTYNLESEKNSNDVLNDLVRERENNLNSWDKSKDDSLNSSSELNVTVVKADSNTFHVSEEPLLNKTETLQKSQYNFNSTFPSDRESNPTPEVHKPQRRGTYEVLSTTETIINNTQCSSNKKRTNDTFSNATFDADKNTTITKSDNLTFDACSSDKNKTYLPINKSCEDILNESSIEVKRRRTSNPKNHKADVFGLQNILHTTLNKPSSLPHLRSLYNNDTPDNSPGLSKKHLSHSTPVRSEFTQDLLIKLRVSDILHTNKDKLDDDNSNKRDSLDCEESLGILTPDQMTDYTQSRSPSLEYAPNRFSAKFVELSQHSRCETINNITEPTALHTEIVVDTIKPSDSVKEDLQSPNLASITDYSLGLIDDQIISHFTLRTDTTMNLELPLDSVGGQIKEYTLTRCEQTPSPEELPLDTTPIVESEPKTEPTKSKTTSSFITSITSITSLDTGYQGDGEMSRPASRGADNSPLTRRPLPRPQPRRPDPMTDSDFYTESDADNHEENQLRGDRRAQVIDGTLYGVDPQAAADIYVNNRENMDSSGIFTDIESNTRNEEDIINQDENLDVSPSDTSSKTLSDNSQTNLQEILVKSLNKNDKIKELETTPPSKENSKKRNAPSPGISSPSSMSSPRHNKEDSASKKYKMPKRDVASKVKAMIEPTQLPQAEKKVTAKKPVGRWDAVMDKISKGDQTKTNLKEIKSKVFNNTTVNSVSATKQTETRKPGMRNAGSPNNKVRRIRTRTALNSSPLKKVTGSVVGSMNSSLSDLSAAGAPPKNLGPTKKRDTIQVTQVLTANKLSPKNHQLQSNLAENNKKNATNSPPSSSESKVKRNIFSSKEKKQPLIKECGKTTVKGGRTSPSVRPPATHNPRAPVKQQQVPRVAEALAVLVQHLVFNVEAYQVPTLRRQCEKYRLEAEEVRLAYQHLEETLANERLMQAKTLEEERIRCRKDITDLVEQHRNQIAQLTVQHSELEKELRQEKESAHEYMSSQHEEQLTTLRREFEKLQRTHEESLDILREENEAIREQIDEKRLEVEKASHESLKLKKDYESNETKMKDKLDALMTCNEKLKQQNEKIEKDFEHKLQNLIEENRRLREENDRLLSYGDDKGIGIQEVQSLRVVLELKQTEVADLRRNLAEAEHKLETLIGAEEKAAALLARCEDLQLQLQRKSEYEQTLIQENNKLQESFKDESNQKRILSQYNEELQYKLKQNKEVINKVMEQAEESIFNRSIISSSFNERHNSTRTNLERTLSFRERSYSNKSNISLEGSNRSKKSKNSIELDMDDLSPPSSPKVKGVVEKSDSVSYVLDLDESPDVVASRIVRRSFRNSTPPKSTPTKSPSNKRARIRNPLSLSASSSSILTPIRTDTERPRSASSRNDDSVFLWNSSPKNYGEESKAYEEMLDESCESGNSSMKLDHLDLDEDNDVDLQLPALPSELDRRNGSQVVLPSPKHLAGEAMVSESNSEDESTSSSQL